MRRAFRRPRQTARPTRLPRARHRRRRAPGDARRPPAASRRRRARRPGRTPGTAAAIAEHRAGCGGPTRCEDHRRCAGRPKLGGVLRVGEEGEVAGAGLLDAGHAVDLDLAVALEPAPEARRDVLELQASAVYAVARAGGRALDYRRDGASVVHVMRDTEADGEVRRTVSSRWSPSARRNVASARAAARARRRRRARAAAALRDRRRAAARSSGALCSVRQAPSRARGAPPSWRDSGRRGGRRSSRRRTFGPGTSISRPDSTKPTESMTSQNRCRSRSRPSCARSVDMPPPARSYRRGRTGRRRSAGRMCQSRRCSAMLSATQRIVRALVRPIHARCGIGRCAVPALALGLGEHVGEPLADARGRSPAARRAPGRPAPARRAPRNTARTGRRRQAPGRRPCPSSTIASAGRFGTALAGPDSRGGYRAGFRRKMPHAARPPARDRGRPRGPRRLPTQARAARVQRHGRHHGRDPRGRSSGRRTRGARSSRARAGHSADGDRASGRHLRRPGRSTSAKGAW